MFDLFKSLIQAAKKVRNFLSLFVFILLGIFSIFIWGFSQGSFDPLIQNLSNLDKDKFFVLVITIIVLLFSVVILGIFLSFIRTSPKQQKTSFATIHVIVHEKNDPTSVISNAEVILILPEPIIRHTEINGSASLIFPFSLKGKKYNINARKQGYKSNRPKKITLKENAQIFIELEQEVTPVQNENVEAFIKTNRDTIKNFLTLSRNELTTGYVAGTSKIEVRQVIEGTDFFITPPWTAYQGNLKNENLIEFLTKSISNGNRFLLLGEPGQGKTTVLKRMYSKITDLFFSGQSSIIPIFVALREVAFAEQFIGTSNWLWDFLSSRYGSAFPLPKEILLTGLQEGKIILLLDRFDEYY